MTSKSVMRNMYKKESVFRLVADWATTRYFKFGGTQ